MIPHGRILRNGSFADTAAFTLFLAIVVGIFFILFWLIAILTQLESSLSLIQANLSIIQSSAASANAKLRVLLDEDARRKATGQP